MTKGDTLMKKHIASFLFASSAALGVAPFALADDAPGMMPPMHGGHPGMRGGPMMGPMMGLRGLDLSQAQEDQVFKIMHEQAPAVHEQVKQLRAAHEALAKAAAADPFDEKKAKDAADQEGKAHAQLALLHAQGMAKVRAVLTAEQRAKLDQRHMAHAGGAPK